MISVHVSPQCSPVLAGFVTVTALVGEALKMCLNVQTKCVLLSVLSCLPAELAAPHFSHLLRHFLDDCFDLSQILDGNFLIAVDFRSLFDIVLTF